MENCKTKRDLFCLVCGIFLTSNVKRRVSISTKISEAYKVQFGFFPSDNNFSPKFMCRGCYNRLYKVENEPVKGFFLTPALWTEPKNHPSDCFFCKYETSFVTYNKTKVNAFPIVSSFTPPSIKMEDLEISHSSSINPPDGNDSVNTIESENSSLKQTNADNDEHCSADETTSSSDQSSEIDLSEFDADDEGVDDPNDVEFKLPKRPKQRVRPEVKLITPEIYMNIAKELDFDIDRQVKYGKIHYRLGLLDKKTKIYSAKSRSNHFRKYFQTESDLTYCKNIDGLFQELGIQHNPQHWRLFIDSGGKTLKALLLHNENVFPSIPVAIAFSKVIKESYDSTKMIIEKINYSKFNWLLICDLKLVTFLRGLQGGNTSNPCFLCLFESRAKHLHYVNHTWSIRDADVIGKHNIKNTCLVPVKNILFPALHIKLGLWTQFIKRFLLKNKPNKKNRNSDEDDDNEDDVTEAKRMIKLGVLKELFPHKSDAKITCGIFDGPEIRKMMHCKTLYNIMEPQEQMAYNSLVSVCQNFLGMHF